MGKKGEYHRSLIKKRMIIASTLEKDICIFTSALADNIFYYINFRGF